MNLWNLFNKGLLHFTSSTYSVFYTLSYWVQNRAIYSHPLLLHVMYIFWETTFFFILHFLGDNVIFFYEKTCVLHMTKDIRVNFILFKKKKTLTNPHLPSFFFFFSLHSFLFPPILNPIFDEMKKSFGMTTSFEISGFKPQL